MFYVYNSTSSQLIHQNDFNKHDIQFKINKNHYEILPEDNSIQLLTSLTQLYKTWQLLQSSMDYDQQKQYLHHVQRYARIVTGQINRLEKLHHWDTIFYLVFGMKFVN